MAMRAPHNQTAAERFAWLEEYRISKEPMSGCWLWLGALSSDGYATGKIDGRTKGIHTVAYRLFEGEVPEGLELDHKCRTRSCVNPKHLRVVTHKVNVLIGESPHAQNARKANCPYGHPLDQIVRRATGQIGRACSVCKAIAYRRDWDANKAKARAYHWANRESILEKMRMRTRARRAAAKAIDGPAG